MSEDEIITLEAFYDPMLAQIIKGRLEANGISCFLADDITIGVNPFYNSALGGVKLKVFARDEVRCREILAEDISDIDMPGDISTETNDTCPFCHSTNISYGIASKKSISWPSMLLSFLFLAVYGAPAYPVRQKKSWHCFNCDKDFDSPDHKPELQ